MGHLIEQLDSGWVGVASNYGKRIPFVKLMLSLNVKLL